VRRRLKLRQAAGDLAHPLVTSIGVWSPTPNARSFSARARSSAASTAAAGSSRSESLSSLVDTQG
jgi:hypothetical protein